MNKLLYIALNYVEGSKAIHDGVASKIHGQSQGLINNGWEVWILALNDKDIVLIDKNNENIEIIASLKNMTKRKQLFKEANKIVSELRINLVYIRYPFSDFSFIWMLRNLKRKVDSIYIEIPTFPIERWGIRYGFKKFVLSRLDIFLSIFLKKYVDQIRIIGVKAKSVYGIPAVNITNGIDYKNINEKENLETEDVFEIITVSSMNHYHGYDRLIYGLSDYYHSGNVSIPIKITMVGDGPMKKEWIDLAKKLNVDKYVEFIGSKSSKELDFYFNKSHMAVGSLGLHRVNLYDISTLKCKEYCARGIPFIYSNEEFDFDSNFPFVFKLEADESSINMNRLIDFYENMTLKHQNYSHELRSYAAKKLSWEQQMKF